MKPNFASWLQWARHQQGEESELGIDGFRRHRAIKRQRSIKSGELRCMWVQGWFKLNVCTQPLDMCLEPREFATHDYVYWCLSGKTLFLLLCAPEWCDLASKPLKSVDRDAAKNKQSEEGTKRWSNRSVTLRVAPCQRTSASISSGGDFRQSNDRIYMHTVLATCCISHYDPIFD